ncbi:putative cupin [Pseudomonas sp. MT-1]|uniref:(R)-mandelonitrile lyase n=1 Tax=Stutzerimonas stutzeri TaxID=316 RepID=UPI00053623E4|nr:cupin domain-containing protein [Pseudomonadaceae bacterium SI-3]BAP80623.1 putative cupin [Pseudomonas sp. MT-1]
MRTLLLTLFISTLVPMAFADEGNAEDQRIAAAGSQASIAGPDAWFTGRARIDPLYSATKHMNASGAYVTFEPGARSAWHTHPKGQYLIVTAGVGRVQQWGEPIQVIKPGDVVWCPPGVKHWHGAAPETAMTHIAVTGTDEQGQNVEWLEKVSDTQYQRNSSRQ